MTPFSIVAQAAGATLATESPAAGPAMLNQLVLFGFIIFIFYFLMIRPQQKKQKEHQRLLQNLKTGDTVITNSGMHGLISNVKEKTIILKVADNVKIEFEKSSISVIEKPAEISASSAS